MVNTNNLIDRESTLESLSILKSYLLDNARLQELEQPLLALQTRSEVRGIDLAMNRVRQEPRTKIPPVAPVTEACSPKKPEGYKPTVGEVHKVLVTVLEILADREDTEKAWEIKDLLDHTPLLTPSGVSGFIYELYNG